MENLIDGELAKSLKLAIFKKFASMISMGYKCDLFCFL